MSTQQQTHDNLLQAINIAKDAINQASQRVANAILAAKGEQVVDVQDLLDGLSAVTTTANAIEPIPVPSEQSVPTT